MAAWDTCFTLMSKPPEEDILRAVLEIQVRKCQTLKPLFFQIEGATANSRKRTYNYLCRSAWVEIDRRQAEVTRLGLLNPSPTAHGAVEAKAKAKRKKDQPKQKSNAIPPPAPAVVAVEACRNYKDNKCAYGDRCKLSHEGKCRCIPKAKAKPKDKLRSPRQKSPVTPPGTVRTKEEKANMKCVWFGTDDGCRRWENCPYKHG